MPNMADLTVKKADGTTDIVYTAMNPSSGDGVPAFWRSESVGASASLKPTLALSTRSNGPKSARRVVGDFVYPWSVTDSTTSVTSVKARIPITLTAAIPLEVPDAVIEEAVAQATNLFVTTVIRASLKSGFAPT